MEVDEIKQVRLDKLANLKKLGVEPYGLRFPRTDSIKNTLEIFQEEKEVVLVKNLKKDCENLASEVKGYFNIR